MAGQKFWLDEPEVAIQHFAYAMRLSPLDPVLQLFLGGRRSVISSPVGMTGQSCGRKKAVRQEPTYLSAVRTLAASNALAGRLEAAQIAVALLRRVDPALRISNLKDVAPLRRPEDLARRGPAPGGAARMIG